MRRTILMTALALAGALFAGTAAAQCTWGCACVGNACGCNSNGLGERCVTGGRGCVVSMCDAGGMALLAPGGSPVRLAAAPAGSAGTAAPTAAAARMDARGANAAETPALFATAAIQSRWEYHGRGRSVARHCSGVIVARYFDRSAAATTRARQRTLVI